MKIFIFFLVVKFSIYLNRLVFLMIGKICSHVAILVAPKDSSMYMSRTLATVHRNMSKLNGKFARVLEYPLVCCFTERSPGRVVTV